MYDAVRSVVEPKWSLDVLIAVSEDGPLNYTEIEERFDTSSDVITDRLRLLTDYGLVERNERTRKDVRYSITRQGIRFLKQISGLDDLLTGG